MKSIVAVLLGLTNYASSSGGHWDYNDFAAWSHNYEMCGTSDQSPINVQPLYAVHDTSVCQPAFNWTVDYSIHAFKVSNNGHSIAVQPVTRIDWDPDIEMETTIESKDGKQYTTLSTNENAIGRFPNYFKPEGSPHDEFCLHSFHFHWGLSDDEGSEHLIDDISYPLELHFVHYSCRRPNLGSALSRYSHANNVTDRIADGGDAHELGVVGIMFDIAEYDNPAFESILNYDVLDEIRYPGASAYPTIIDDLYLQDIIPDGIFDEGYYSYEGSLTTPPCTNIVRWHVMNARSYIGKSQMARFRQLMYNKNITMAPNYREVQHNVHTVYACMAEEVDIVEVNAMERLAIWIYTVFILLGMCAFSGYCWWRNKQNEEIQAAKPKPKTTRLRAPSRSSVGHDQRRQSHDGDAETHTHV